MAAKSLFTRMRSVAIKYLNSIYDLVDLQRELVVFLEHESWHRAIRQAPYNDPKRLLGFGYMAFSESDEDGLIAEIFRRIGVESRTFFEFGVGDGLANITLNLLLVGWSGYWIDGSATFVKLIEERLPRIISTGQ